MRHTEDEIEQAARKFDELANDLDPDTVQSDNTEDLTQIAAASAIVARTKIGSGKPWSPPAQEVVPGTRSPSPSASPDKPPGNGSPSRPPLEPISSPAKNARLHGRRIAFRR